MYLLSKDHKRYNKLWDKNDWIHQLENNCK
jgi:hypothetical protein